MPDFGKLVRHQRESMRIPLNHFAARIGISPAYWSRIERGLEKPPLNPLIESAARELNIPLDDAFVSAGRLPPDIQADLAVAVAIFRKRQAGEAVYPGVGTCRSSAEAVNHEASPRADN